MQMYLASVSVRRVEEFTEAERSAREPEHGELNQKIYAQIKVQRNRPIEAEPPV